MTGGGGGSVDRPLLPCRSGGGEECLRPATGAGGGSGVGSGRRRRRQLGFWFFLFFVLVFYFTVGAA